MCLRVSYNKQYEEKNNFYDNIFFGILKVTEERSRIWNRIHKSEVKCHGSPTLGNSLN